MITVTVYRKENCPICDQTLLDLNEIQEVIPHHLVVVQIEDVPAVREVYEDKVPVVEVGPYRLTSAISKQDLMVALGAARDRSQHMEKVGDTNYQQRVQRGQTISNADRVSYWLSNHYTLLINIIIFVYVGVPFLAPVLMKVGAEGPAKVIYAIYSPLCHQFAFRSWFLFGEQSAYPRQLAGVPNTISYEQATGFNSLDIQRARSFVGNEQLGYKVAICERDVAIYLSIFLFGLVFSLFGKRLKSIPWYIWLLIGIVPIGIDGFSQLPSLSNLFALSWLPIRESTPFLRTLTGGLFGFLTAWYGFPYIEETMGETRQLLTRKIAIITSKVQ